MTHSLLSTPRRLLGTTLALAALGLGTAHAQSYVNVTVGGVFAPGVYGQVTMGNAPPPPVYNTRPVVVTAPVVVNAPVVYMHVPDEHRHHWSHYCGRYNACGRPVQFVQVNMNYRWWEGRGDYRSYDRYDERRDYRRDDGDRYDGREGRGEGRGYGHDNGKHRGHDKRRGDD